MVLREALNGFRALENNTRVEIHIFYMYLYPVFAPMAVNQCVPNPYTYMIKYLRHVDM